MSAESDHSLKHSSVPSPKVIYDFGANNGDDLPYYLKKADRVVAVEANPALCRAIEQRFSAEIQSGRLAVENCVLTADAAGPQVPFYLHKRHHVLGQFPPPDPAVLGDYERVLLPSQSVLQILAKHGAPYYLKIDIEGHDEVILRELFRNNIRPPFLSAESTSIQVFALLLALGNYSAFKLVEGVTVHKTFRRHTITVDGAPQPHSFPRHSAGPFGDDIPGPWLNPDDLFDLLAARKMGWRDIHATSLVQPDPQSSRQQKRLILRHLRGWLKAKLRPRQ